MNNLSWMIYLAGAVGSLSTVATIVAVGAGVGGTVSTIATAIKVDFDNIGERDKKPAIASGWSAGKGFFKVAIATALIASIIPGRDTIYAIAASEMGEDLINTPTASKAVKALDAWLDRQIASPASDGK